MSRAEALEFRLERYFSGIPCRRGHLSERYALNGNCIECQTEHSARKKAGRRGKPPISFPLPKKQTSTDFANLNPTQIDEWYMRVRNLRQNAQRYKHRPLDEVSVLYSPPARKAPETMK